VGKSWRFDMGALEQCVTCVYPGMIARTAGGSEELKK
jgi:hypothetical protein